MNGRCGYGISNATAANGTAFTRVVPPRSGLQTVIDSLKYAAGNTAHTLTLLKPIANGTTLGVSQPFALASRANSAESANTANTITLRSALGPTGNLLAANDMVAVRESDGITRVFTVEALTNSNLTIRFVGAGFTTGVSTDAKVWMLGLVGDTDPRTGLPHQQFAAAATVAGGDLANAGAVNWSNPNGFGISATIGQDEPIVFYSPNTTNAGILGLLTFGHVMAA